MSHIIQAFGILASMLLALGAMIGIVLILSTGGQVDVRGFSWALRLTGLLLGSGIGLTGILVVLDHVTRRRHDG